MLKKIKVHKDKKTKEFFLKLEDFKDLFDISKIEFYEIKTNNLSKDGFIITFFDKDKNQLHPL